MVRLRRARHTLDEALAAEQARQARQAAIPREVAPSSPPAAPALCAFDRAEFIHGIQGELQRAGCDPGGIDGTCVAKAGATAARRKVVAKPPKVDRQRTFVRATTPSAESGGRNTERMCFLNSSGTVGIVPCSDPRALR